MIQLVGTDLLFFFITESVESAAGYRYQIPGINTGIGSNVNRTQPEAGGCFNSKPEVREVCRGA